MTRTRSLFVRLLVAQVVVTIALTATLAAVFYLERNRTVAQLVAVRWAPALKRLAGGAPPGSIGDRAPGAVYTSSERPGNAFELASMTPRLVMVRDALLDEGVPVLELALAPRQASGRDAPALWVALRGDDGATRWVGFESGVVETRLRERLVLALVLLSALAVVASALVARRLARPLEALRARIAADDAGGGPLPQASAEVQAIDQAWRTLRLSLDRQERERALLLAGVSHDLRSPLARIRMAAELLPDSEGVAPRRDVIVRNAVLADRLVGSFLDHVRSGELPLRETVDVAAIARTSAAQLQRTPGEMVVEAPSVLEVQGANAVLIERVVANLLDNAFRHGRAPVTLRVSAPPGCVRIDVEDSGRGIPVDQQQAMLQAFARGDVSRRQPGLGLGLAVVHRVAIRLGGRVSFAESAARHTVTLEWPLSGMTDRTPV